VRNLVQLRMSKYHLSPYNLLTNVSKNFQAHNAVDFGTSGLVKKLELPTGAIFIKKVHFLVKKRGKEKYTRYKIKEKRRDGRRGNCSNVLRGHRCT